MVGGLSSSRRSGSLSLWSFVLSFDWLLLFGALALSVYGLLMIYSATHADPGQPFPLYYVRNQGIGLGLGVALCFLLSVFDYERYARWQRQLYALMLALLAITLFVGTGRGGAHRWISLPFFDIQTAEIAKLLVIVTLAAFLADRVSLRNRLRFVVLAVAYIVPPAALVFLQPDLGTSLVFVAILASMLLVWGVSWRHGFILAGTALLGAVAIFRVLPVLGLQVLRGYQLQRLFVFLNPDKDTTGVGYQLLQSRIAVGSGMFSGKGFLAGTQTHLRYLPEHHTDFIFAVIGEEFGFLGAIVLLGLYVLVLWRLLRIAARARSLFGSLICSGIAGMLVFQAFVNIGMTIGIMPVTGIPLPFVSFGSSSLVVFWLAIGLAESIQVRSSMQAYAPARVPLSG